MVLGMPATGVGLAVQRLYAHAAHQRGEMPAPDVDAVLAQRVAQHAAAGKRMLQVQPVNAPHQLQVGGRCRMGQGSTGYPG